MRLLNAAAGVLVTLGALAACGGAPSPSPSPSGPPVTSPSASPAGVSSPPAASASPSVSSPPLPDGFVALSDVDPTILQDIRYATAHNFVGRPVTGYERPRCLLARKAAEALKGVQQKALEKGYSLKVYDCYRPQRAVDDFVRWSHDADQRMKGEFYPQEAKSRLFDDGYIGGPTAHSRGSTMDLTIVALPARSQPAYDPATPLVPCTSPAGERFPDNTVDMGTGFDCFDPLAHTAAGGVGPAQRANRELLTGLMAGGGFTNYPKEWWHYTLRNEPFPDTYYDFPVA
ncbi:M15 family metallopeptidase [Dactylosporangium sp. CA-139066]|uniref:M15 family metallopeptidase n=1 Tax=Dactylosporangium sp. CA-139066 TaxID=3239930 RepID=UPI003D8CA601